MIVQYVDLMWTQDSPLEPDPTSISALTVFKKASPAKE